MLKGVDIKQRIEFSYSKDTVEPKTVFVLRPLSGSEMLSFTGSTEDILKMVELSVVEVRNYSIEGSVSDVIRSLDLSVMGELIKEVNRVCRLSEQDAKN